MATPSGRVTKEAYDRVEMGMARPAVERVIGRPGEEMSRSEFAGIVTVLYSWRNPDGSNMIVTFQNDRSISKAQFGL